jgi:hypothetical protein
VARQGRQNRLVAAPRSTFVIGNFLRGTLQNRALRMRSWYLLSTDESLERVGLSKACGDYFLERETGIGPATNSLEGCDSTTELLPPLDFILHGANRCSKSKRS